MKLSKMTQGREGQVKVALLIPVFVICYFLDQLCQQANAKDMGGKRKEGPDRNDNRKSVICY